MNIPPEAREILLALAVKRTVENILAQRECQKSAAYNRPGAAIDTRPATSLSPEIRCRRP